MRHLWQWFCGYVCVVLKGNQINRFLNLCSRNGISFWRISHGVERTIHAHIRLKSFFLLKPYLKKTKTKIRILYRKGFPFWCHRHPRLKWFCVVLLLVVSVLSYSYTYVWKIEIYGNHQISSYELEKFLENQNIKRGLKKDQVDCSYLERLIRQNFEQIGWVSVHFKETSLCIEVKESLYDSLESVPNTENVQFDLVANKDAYIYSIVTRFGTAKVTANTFVNKGDILVYGFYNVYDDAGEVKAIRKVYAQALVYGDVEYQFYYPLNEMEIFALKIAGNNNDEQLDAFVNKKTNYFVDKLEDNQVIILDKDVIINKKEHEIILYYNIKVRQQIGINIPVEENRENEFE